MTGLLQASPEEKADWPLSQSVPCPGALLLVVLGPTPSPRLRDLLPRDLRDHASRTGAWDGKRTLWTEPLASGRLVAPKGEECQARGLSHLRSPSVRLPTLSRGPPCAGHSGHRQEDGVWGSGRSGLRLAMTQASGVTW